MKNLTNTDTVDEQRPSIANHPAVEGKAPGSREHQQTDKHDGRILNQAPTTTDPDLISFSPLPFFFFW